MAQSIGAFTATGSMITARILHTSTLLTNGKVLVAGGGMFDRDSTRISSAELYDPLTRTFSPTGNLTTARAWHAATLLPDGKVLLVGGSEDGSAEVYDPSTGSFNSLGNI